MAKHTQWDESDMYRRRSAGPNKLSFELSINSNDSTNGEKDDILLQSPAIKTLEVSGTFCSELVVIVWQDSIWIFPNELADMQDDQKRRYKPLCTKGENVDCYCDPSPSKPWNSWLNLLNPGCKPLQEEIAAGWNQLFGTARGSVQLQKPGEHKRKEVHGTMEERKCTILKRHCESTCIIYVPYSDCMFIAVSSNQFKALVCSRLRSFRDCSTAEISRKLQKSILIEPDVRLTDYKSDESL